MTAYLIIGATIAILVGFYGVFLMATLQEKISHVEKRMVEAEAKSKSLAEKINLAEIEAKDLERRMESLEHARLSHSQAEKIEDLLSVLLTGAARVQDAQMDLDRVFNTVNNAAYYARILREGPHTNPNSGNGRKP